ncbi:MAG: hypothetical protein JRE18_06650 [Deltaproteobacteria bacterium]|nr:hypothetical protein [Deltaproteobacteria bacterium]
MLDNNVLASRRAGVAITILFFAMAAPAAAPSAAEPNCVDAVTGSPSCSQDPVNAAAPTARWTGDPVGRWSIAIAGFVTSFDTSARWDTDVPGPGAGIDVEELLGLDDRLTKLRIDGVYRLGRRSFLNAGVLSLHRSSERVVLDRTIEWGDRIFELGATVSSDFDTDVYRVGWSYNLYSGRRTRVGASVGLSVFDLFGGIRGVATADGDPGSAEFRDAETEKILAPVPVVGFRVGVDLGQKWTLAGHAQLFKYKDDSWDVEHLDTYLALEYLALDHWSMGAGYDFFKIEYGQDRDDLQARYTFDGLMVFVRVRF